jgi:hypothetical protein
MILVILFILYSVIKPYFGWQKYTIDNFITFEYPSDWHLQIDDYKMLSGEEYLFLISDYNGELSRQDISSSSQKYLIESNRTLKTDMVSIEEYAKPFLHKCDNYRCSMKIDHFQKSGKDIIKLSLSNENGRLSVFGGEYFLFIDNGKYLYEIRVGYVPGLGTFSDFLRQKTIDKIVGSIVIK